jgi:hypothetical protein
MQREPPCLKRQVPIYIWMPIVIACAGLGFIASKWRPVAPVVSEPPIHRNSEMPAPRTGEQTEHQISRALSPPGYAPAISLPADEVDLPTPARKDVMPALRTGEQTEHQISRALSPPGRAPAISLPTDEVDLPTPARTDVQRDEPANNIVRGTLPAQASRPSPQPTKAARRERVAKTRRATAQQPTKALSAPSGGLKNVPIIGSLFSLFQ